MYIHLGENALCEGELHFRGSFCMFFMHFALIGCVELFALVLGDRSRFWLLSFACGLFLVFVWHLVTWLDFLFPSSCYVLISPISYGGGGVLTMHSSRGRLRGLGDPSHYAE